DGIRDRNVTGVQTCALPISQVLLFFICRILFAGFFSSFPHSLCSFRFFFGSHLFFEISQTRHFTERRRSRLRFGLLRTAGFAFCRLRPLYILIALTERNVFILLIKLNNVGFYAITVLKVLGGITASFGFTGWNKAFELM